MTRRADDTPTGNRPIFFRLPPAAYAELQRRAGPVVRGKPSGPAEYVRQLVLRDLGMEEVAVDHAAASVREGAEYGKGYRARRREEGRPIRKAGKSKEDKS